MTARRFLLAALLAAPAGAGEVAPESYGLHKLRAASAAAAEPAAPSAFQARLKWFTAGTALPKNDAARRALGDAAPFRHNADLRLMWRRDFRGLRLTAEHAVTALRDRALGFGGISALTLEQTPAADAGRLLDLAWTVDEGSNARLSHRFDRLAIEYRTSRWAVTAGRQAVSWGAGLVFQPMDLLSPFAPTTVDVDYKPGDDLVLVERLFESGADLQLLAVGRRAPGEAVRDASSVAAKYRGSVGANEFELMIARHRAENVFAIGLRVPIGGALLRSDIVLAEGEGGTAVSAVLNADYTVAVAGTALHLFGEYFHNGHGVRRLPERAADLPAPLVARLGPRRSVQSDARLHGPRRILPLALPRESKRLANSQSARRFPCRAGFPHLRRERGHPPTGRLRDAVRQSRRGVRRLGSGRRPDRRRRQPSVSPGGVLLLAP